MTFLPLQFPFCVGPKHRFRPLSPDHAGVLEGDLYAPRGCQDAYPVPTLYVRARLRQGDTAPLQSGWRVPLCSSNRFWVVTVAGTEISRVCLHFLGMLVRLKNMAGQSVPRVPPARGYARQNLTPDRIFCYYYRALSQYASRQKGVPAVTPDMVRVDPPAKEATCACPATPPQGSKPLPYPLLSVLPSDLATLGQAAKVSHSSSYGT